MGDTLFGGEKSGTPREVQGGTQDLAKMFQQMIASGQVGQPGRMTSESWMNMLGFDPREIGLNDAVVSALRDPADQTRGLFSAMAPFEAQETGRQVAGLRDSFGTMGGRFSRNLLQGEGELRTDLAQSFGLNRQQGLLDAARVRNDALAAIMGATATGAGMQNDTLRTMAQFLQPGGPVFTEGLMPGLIGAGGNLLGMWLMNRTLNGGGSGGRNLQAGGNPTLPRSTSSPTNPLLLVP